MVHYNIVWDQQNFKLISLILLTQFQGLIANHKQSNCYCSCCSCCYIFVLSCCAFEALLIVLM